MTDIVDSRRRSAMMARIRGRDSSSELAVRCNARWLDRRFRLHSKNPLETPVLPSGLAHYRLVQSKTSDSGPNSGLRSPAKISRTRPFEAHAILTVAIRAAFP